MASANEYEALLGDEGIAPKAGAEYHDIIATDKVTKKAAVQQSMFAGSGENPDQAAKIQQLSAQTNLPPNIVARNFDRLAKKNVVESQDYDALIDNSPGLATWLQDPNNAAVAHDDIDNLKGIESNIGDYTKLKSIGNSVARGLLSAAGNVSLVPGLAADVVLKRGPTKGLITKEDIGLDGSVNAYLQEKANQFQSPDLETSIIKEVGAGNYKKAGMGLAAQFFSNAPNQAAILAATFYGGPSAGLQFAFSTSAAGKYNQNMMKRTVDLEGNPLPEPGLGGSGADPRNAMANALATGGIEAAFENLGTFSILKSWEKQIAKQAGKEVSKQTMMAFSKEIAASMAGEANEEFLTSIAQDFTDYITGVNPDGLKGMMERATNAGIVGGASGGAMTAPAGAFMGVEKLAKARNTTITKEFYSALGSTLEATKLRKRLPESQKKLVEEITKNSDVENIYISADAVDKYFQNQEENPVAVMQQLGAAEAYAEAKATGSDIKIPLANWVTQFVGSDHYEGLADHIKFNQDDLSQSELKEEQAKTKADLEQAAAETPAPQEEAFSESGKLVQKNVAEQLKAINQDPRQSVLYRGFEVIGKRAGIDPLELYNKYALRIGTGQGSIVEQVQPEGPDVFDLAIAEYQKQLPAGAEISPEERQMFDQAKTEAKTQVRELAKNALANIPDVSTDAVAEAFGLPKNEVRLLTKGIGKRSGKKATGSYSVEEILAAGKQGQKQVLNQNIDQQNAPAFYSKMIKTVEEKMGASATVEQINGMLKEIKPDERKWMGLDEFLKGKTKVSKEELLANLRGNQVQIEEVVKGEQGIGDLSRIMEKHNIPGDYEDDAENSLIADDILEKYADVLSPEDKQTLEKISEAREDNSTKFSQYTLPGGENYREVLFALPEKIDNPEAVAERTKKLTEDVERSDKLLAESTAINQELRAALKKNKKLKDRAGEIINSIYFSQDVRRTGTQTDEQLRVSKELDELMPTKKLKEMLDKSKAAYIEFTKQSRNGFRAKEELRKLADGKKESSFQSSHFSEPNVLAHTRLNDRVDADGKKVLFVEEIQSDWHQAGRKKGYKGDIKFTPLTEESITDFDDNGSFWSFHFKNGAGNEVVQNIYKEKWDSVKKKKVDAGLTLETAKKEAISAINEIEERTTKLKNEAGTAVPDAPFRKTWHEFVLKRLIREAAEKGYDKIAWTTGEQQADRYNLAKQVDEVQAFKNEDGTFDVEAWKGGKVLQEGKNLNASQLESQLGKDLAAKIIAEDGKDVPLKGGKAYTGNDLKVGGEGMKGFYDKILPDFANKFGKKYGAKVTDSEIEAEPNGNDRNLDKFRVVGTDGDIKATGEDLEQAKRNAESFPGSKIFAPGEQITLRETVHSLEITPELKAAALNEGFSLFQGSDQGPRGQLTINRANRQFNIDILKNANRSTFLHETGHFYLEVLGDVVQGLGENVTPEQQRLKDDYHEILKWFGVENREGIQTDQHEQFARGFEAYLMEGKAPNKSLRQVFARFKVWLTAIYRQVKNLNVELTPEVRGVMDRLLATDEEISQVQRDLNAQPLFGDPAKYGMTKAFAEKYEAARVAARTSAENALTSKVMGEMERKQTKEYKAREAAIREEVTKTLEAGLVYSSIDLLKSDQTMESGTPLKILRSSLAGVYEPEFLKKLPRGVIAEDGLDFNVLGESLGFQSGDDMLTQMANAPDKAALIDQTVEARLADEYPELYLQGPLFHEEAVKDYHNENRGKMLRMELEHIASNNMPVLKEAIRRVAKRVPSEQLVREQAREIIGGKKISEIKPYTFERAEAKAAKQAGEFLAKGDFDQAFEAKRRELLNYELHRAATEALETAEKALEKFKVITKTSEDESLAKKRDMDLVNAARAVLAQFSITRTDRTAQSYIEPIKQYDPDTYGVVLSLIESATERVGPYDEIPFNDFSAMNDSVLAMWDMAKSAKEIEIDGQVLNREEVMAQMTARLNELAPKEKRAGYERAVTNWDKAKLGLMGIKAALRRVESWVDAVDGDQGEKIFRKFMWNPISESTTQYRLQKKIQLEKYLEIVKKIEGRLTFKEIASSELNYRFKDKAELLGAMLHMGNESNLSKLLRGRGWGDYNEAGELDTSRWNAFLNRMVQEGTLTKADFDYAQDVWNLLEELKPMAQQAHKKMYGHYFNEITANEFQTPFGTYRGGYVPAIADPFIAVDAAIRNEKELLEKSDNSFMFPTAGRGFTKGRVNQYAAPLEMNVASIPRHIDKVMRFAVIEPHVKEVGRIVMNKAFREQLNDFDPTVGGDMLVPWLQRAAQQKVSATSNGFGGRAADTFFRELRTRTGFATMTANVVNTLQQFTGISIAAVKVRPKHLRNSLWNYVRSPRATADMVAEKSDFMKTKMGAQAQEVQSTIDDLLLDANAYDKVRDFASKHGYFMQGATQNIVDTITWGGAYDQAVSNGLTEKEAVREADAAVRQTQGSFSAEDVSRYETGTPLMRAFTMFYSYFNMQANLLGTEFQKTIRDMGLRKGAGRGLYIYAIGFMIPAVLSEVLVTAMSGNGFDDDDDDQYLDDLMRIFFGSQFRGATAMFPVLGPTVNAGINRWNDKAYDDRISTSPAVSAIESTIGAPFSVYKAIAENGSKKTAIRDTLTAMSVLTGIPVAPLSRPLGYLADIDEGKAQPTGPVDAARGLITGKPGK